MARLLIIEDEDDLRMLLSRMLKLEGFEVAQEATARGGMERLRKFEPHVVLSDVRLPDGYGVELVAEIKKALPEAEVVLLTAYGNIEDGVQAIKNGAFDYITKGDDNNRIIPLVHKAAEKAMLQFRVRELEAQAGQRHSFDDIIGRSPALRAAVEMARRVARTDATVLLTGETGTGKEVFAQAIHYESPRRGKPFVAINCSALGRDLLESELFGHKAGAFTGASRDKKGLFEEASGGTLFLDEIGEMDLDLQAKLLRVLETGTFIKVGETRETRVDVRVIAATNRDLAAESEAGRFRSDLYYRLSVFAIELPPLRRRPEDIPLLARHFAEQIATRMRRPVPALSEAFVERLMQMEWKGNVRELRNAMERAVILAEGAELTPDLLDAPGSRRSVPGDWSLAAAERAHIVRVLQHTGGNKTQAARLLGIGLTTLYRKIEEYGIGK